MGLKLYVRNVAVAFDQLLNALFLGDPDETISSRTGKYVREGRGWFPCQLCKLLDYVFREKHHCLNSIEDNEGAEGISWQADHDKN